MGQQQLNKWYFEDTPVPQPKMNTKPNNNTEIEPSIYY